MNGDEAYLRAEIKRLAPRSWRSPRSAASSTPSSPIPGARRAGVITGNPLRRRATTSRARRRCFEDDYGATVLGHRRHQLDLLHLAWAAERPRRAREAICRRIEAVTDYLQPSHIVACFDRRSFATISIRPTRPIASPSLPACRRLSMNPQAVASLAVPCAVEGFEADDCLATLARYAVVARRPGRAGESRQGSQSEPGARGGGDPAAVHAGARHDLRWIGGTPRAWKNTTG